MRCGIAFMARAKQLGKQNNLAGAMKDLTLAREGLPLQHRCINREGY